MRKIAFVLSLIILTTMAMPAIAAENATGPAAAPSAAAPAGADTPDQLKEELEILKKQIAALEERLKAQEKQTAAQPHQPVLAEVTSELKELDQRVSQTERSQALDRISFTGDYRFEAHSIRGSVPAHSDHTDALLTNRLRLKFDAKIADNISFTGRLSMYKAFGDSTGVQVFNGQPNTLNSDGSTAGVPNSDQLRVDRAYFSWNRI